MLKIVRSAISVFAYTAYQHQLFGVLFNNAVKLLRKFKVINYAILHIKIFFHSIHLYKSFKTKPEYWPLGPRAPP